MPSLLPSPQEALGEVASSPLQEDNSIHTFLLLPPSEWKDESLDDLFATAIDDALLLDSTQEPSPITPTRIEPAPPNERQVFVEQKRGHVEADGESEGSTHYEDLFLDAKDHFRGKKPDFLTAGPTLGTTRIVDMVDGQIGEMKFEIWDKTKSQGFWTVEDSYGKHIVKFFRNGNCYRTWRGIENGYGDEAIAWPEKIRTCSATSLVEAGSGPDDEFQVVQNIHTRLRQKTYSQKYPYTVDKEIHTSLRKGKMKRITEIDAREAKREGTLKRISASMNPATRRQTQRGTQKKQRRSCSTTSNLSDITEFTPEEFRLHIQSKTSLLTKLPPDDEPLPIFLSECLNATSLWDKIVSAWESDINGTVHSMSIRFPWLGSEYNIKFKAGFSSPYEKMIEEIQDAPCWKDGSDKCSVEVVLRIT
jgi:hypothetical protein